MLSLNLNIPKELLQPIEAEIDTDWLTRLSLALDAILFGPNGSIARRIGAQEFKPLDEGYKEQKQRQGMDVRIWVRTGQLLDIVLEQGEAPKKHLRLYPQNLLTGSGPVWEAELSLPYIVYVDRERPLLHWTEADRDKAAQVVFEFLNELLVKRFGR